MKKMEDRKHVTCLLLVINALLFTACSPRIYPAKSDTTTIVRTEVREVLKDTTIYITLPQDSVSVVTRDTVSILNIDVAVSEAMISDGLLYHNLYAHPDYKPEVVVQYKDRIEYRDTIMRASETKVIEVEKPLNGWQKAVMALGYIMMGAMVGTIVYGILKFKKVI